MPELNFRPSNLFCLRPWLEASNITFSTFWLFNLVNIWANLIGSIVVFDKFRLTFFDLTPKVPIEATLLLFNFNIW